MKHGAYAFQPEAVEALAAAFHKSWSFIADDPCFATQDQILLQRLLSMCLMQFGRGRRTRSFAARKRRHLPNGATNTAPELARRRNSIARVLHERRRVGRLPRWR